MALVTGRRRERFPEASPYKKLADLEWDMPPGEVQGTHGDIMVRVEAFRQVGGFDPAVLVSEDYELCVRLRRAGYHLLRIDADLSLHDMPMTRFKQWWLRSVRTGYGYADGARLHGRPPERHCIREVRSILFWGVALPAIVLALAWPTRGASLLLLAGYLVMYWRVRRYCDRPGMVGAGRPPLRPLVPARQVPLRMGPVHLLVPPVHAPTSLRNIEYRAAVVAPPHRELSVSVHDGQELIVRSRWDSWAPATSPTGTPRPCAPSAASGWRRPATATLAAPCALASRYGIDRVYASLDEMLAGPRLDAIHVLLPPDAHARAAVEIIDAGVHVLLEKPMVARAEDADALIERARARGVAIGVGHNFLFAPVYERLRGGPPRRPAGPARRDRDHLEQGAAPAPVRSV